MANDQQTPECKWLGISLRQPDAFDFTNAASWPTWKIRYEDYAAVSGVSHASAEVQVRSLLYCMGPGSRPLLDTFSLSAEELLSYETVVKRFTEHFVHPANELYESSRFHKRTQEPGESVDAYYAELSRLVKRCSYPSVQVEERLVRDRFVVGLRDARLSEQLCRNSKLSLKEAWTQARQWEDAEKEKAAKGTAEGFTPVELDAAKAHKAPRRPEARQRYVPPKTEFSGAATCSFCGRSPHPRSECPARASLCNYCRKKGHFAEVCRSRKAKATKLATIHLHTVVAPEHAKYVDVTVNDYTASFKVDSGAEVSAVPADFPAVPLQLDKVDNLLTGPGGQPLHVLGSYVAQLLWKGKGCAQRLYVVQSLTTPLLGFPALQALEVIRFLGDVATPPPKHHAELFKGLGTLKDEYQIRLKPDAVPFSLSAPRRVPIPLQGVVRQELDRMEAEGVIRRIDKPTPWCAGLVAVPKASGGYRICVDLTRLNEVVLRERHILPTVEQVLGLIGDAKTFSKLDATAGFHQVKLAPESQELTTFVTPFGRYCFCRLPFGITSAPEYFQKQMARILEGQEGVANMIDDILVFGRDKKEHDVRLEQVLSRLSKAGITLNQDKCCFGVSEVPFLGVVVSADGIRPDPDKLEAIKTLEAPKDIAELRRLLGMVNHLARFLPNISEITAPLRALLSKRTAWAWHHEQETAFSKIKQLLVSDRCMAKYHPSYATTISADASSFGLGAVLLQTQPSGERRPVAFASRSMTATEQRYSQTEKEALAATWAMRRFDEFVRGINFAVETDHQPLVTLFGKMELDMLPPRVQRLRLKLMHYQFTMQYVPGKLLATADALSRIPPKVSAPLDTVELFATEVVSNASSTLPLNPDDIKRAQSTDGECTYLISLAQRDWPHKKKLPLHLTKYAAVANEITVCDGLLLKGPCIVVPTSLRPAVLNLLHDGHQGVNRCKAKARDSVWWPGIAKDIESMVARCEQCARTRINPAEPLISTPLPGHPWEVLGMDLFHSKGQTFLLVVDYYSRFPEVITLRSSTASAVVEVLKSIFARHGIPEVVRSDNGPPFSSHELKRFADSYGFTLVTSSPHFPQSNGEAERMVRTVKDLLGKASDPHLALLSYRDTPGVNGFSPAQLLMGRQLRTRLPKMKQLLQPSWPARDVVATSDASYKMKSECNFNQHHRARPLPLLETGERVWVRPEGVRATVLSEGQRPRCYVVETDQGAVLQRNRRHLSGFSQQNHTDPAIPTDTTQGASPANPTADIPDTALNVAPDVGSDPRDDGVVRTRSGRRVVPPARLNL